MQSLRHSKDLWAGLIFIGFGVGFMSLAPSYDIGSLARPGPGFFPAALATLSILIGVATAVRGLRVKADRIDRFAIGPFVVVILSMVAFAVTIERFGVVPAIIATTLVASYGSRDYRWQTRLAAAVLLTAFCVIVFVFGLGLPLKLFGPAFGAR